MRQGNRRTRRPPIVTITTLTNGDWRIRVSTQGGAIVDGYWRDQPVFRPYPEAMPDDINPLKCGSFPLVPFGNRVAGNAFEVNGRRYHLSPNTDWDPLYLHGDAWLQQWQTTSKAPASMELSCTHESDTYTYQAGQAFELKDNTLSVVLSVRNTGARAMPFGLGHHPFFALTPETTLRADAEAYWTEKQNFLPDQRQEVPQKLNFSKPAAIPDEWINNGFDGWNGEAIIQWPERNSALTITCSENFNRFFLFHSDTAFEPGFKNDYFCFEPMTHDADGHARFADSGLVLLEPGQELTTHMALQMRAL